MKLTMTVGAGIAFFCLLLASTQAAAQGSTLRVSCEGESLGAEVSINGQFKGECPLDIQVQAGPIKLRATKNVDALRMRVFEQEMRMGDGIVKRTEVRLRAPEFTPEGRKKEDERIQREQAAAQALDEQRRKAEAEGNVLLDREVDQLLQAKRAQRAVQTPECPDCPPLVLPPGERPVRLVLPAVSDPEIAAWMPSIERELAAYLVNPQENFRLPSQVQPWPCEAAQANVRRIAGLVDLVDQTPQQREEYRKAMKPMGAGESSYYYRDVRMWPVQMACKNGKLDGPVDVWVFSTMVSDNPNHLSISPVLIHLRLAVANGEIVGPVHRVERRNGGEIRYKDAATDKMMKENGVGDFEVFSISYRFDAAASNARSVVVMNPTYANSKYQHVDKGTNTIINMPLGAGRSEQLSYEGARLAMRTPQKDGKPHGRMVVYAQTFKTGFLVPDIKTSDTIYCYREGVLVKEAPCNVQ
ncbi:MAG: hypothetical protein IH605_19150 [Burkholderiales bacterium]|nr:hypothetical protein [Burkholderiales bacterium]